ncbi:EAL domain-containing protein [Vreelandella rituensis]|uniref:EAL domain-containing protein n=1 Tax=Vreelandella rituensis TaxID=2282306 RepID=A0A368TQ19_9GAMM|nr:EAL domain-containing protein [Halomonas rituensis]RCV86680.1 EAL domain-containing protein [Halomonas rituensis]
MLPASIPSNEPQRLRALKRYLLNDRSDDLELDHITRLAAVFCQADYALISMVDEQHQWFKSRYGSIEKGETPRETSFCAHVVASGKLLEIPDARDDPRFATSSWVIEAPFLVFYFGVPLLTPDGLCLGSLCVFSCHPKKLSDDQRDLLAQLASEIMLILEYRLAERAQRATRQAGIGVWEMDVATRSMYWNEVIYALYELSPDNDAGLFERLAAYAPEDRRSLTQALNQVINQQQSFSDTYQLNTAQGNLRWVRITAYPIVVDSAVTRLIGTMCDITSRKEVEARLLRQQSLEHAILRAQACFLEESDNQLAFEQLLKDILELTESEYGFIGEIQCREDGSRFLKTHAITDNVSEKTYHDFFADHSSVDMAFNHPDSALCLAMHQGEVVISNAPETNIESSLPLEHPPLNAFLGIPILVDNTPIAMLGLANRSEGYTHALIEFLAPLLGSIGQLIKNLSIQRRYRQDQQAIARLSMVAKQTSNGVMITDAQGGIEWINESFSRLSGYSLDEIKGQRPSHLLEGPKTDKQTSRRFSRALAQGKSIEGELLNYRKDGSTYWVHVNCNPLSPMDHMACGFISIHSDISTAKAHADALYSAAYLDELTGLPNQRLINEKLQHFTRQADYKGATLLVQVLDLDDFKRINDLLGHDIGDGVLKLMGKRLQEAIGEIGIVGRLGGDEFVVIWPTDLPTPPLVDAIGLPFTIEGQRLKVTTSSGITHYPQDSADPDTLIRHAYQALYQAKALGAANTTHYDPAKELSTRERNQERRHMAKGLHNNEFRLYYQPQVNLKTHQVIGVEALIRWQHPERGLLPPIEFLPLIEGSELEFHLGEWVIEAALKQLVTWQADGISLPISVNISPQHLLHPGFMSQLKALLAAYPAVLPHLLSLEILESATLDDMQTALEVLKECRQLHIDVALDDFGTGYSSLAYFRQLPVQLIKVDRDFVRDMLESKDDRAIVESIVFMARKFSRPVLAEGVETMAHAQALVELGCFLAQGYGIARPMPADQFPGWLANWQAEHR